MNQTRQAMGIKMENAPTGNPAPRPGMELGMGGQVHTFHIMLHLKSTSGRADHRRHTLMKPMQYLQSYQCFPLSAWSAWLLECSDDGSAQQRDDDHTDEETADDDANAAATTAATGCSRRLQRLT